jgi:hypothetical protein
MDDVFYFSELQVGLADIAILADRRGMPRVLRSGGLVITLGEGPYDHCHWADFGIDEAEPKDAEDLRRSGIRSGLCISHHPVAMPALKPLLRDVLAAYGGWVGSDDDGFHPRFTLFNLELLVDQGR